MSTGYSYGHHHGYPTEHDSGRNQPNGLYQCADYHDYFGYYGCYGCYICGLACRSNRFLGSQYGNDQWDSNG